ncbi:hypothetical protein [Paracoccus contaminans]|uniref:hypothetical protein n=1 Tax=Paracoccus contaminans TaxID=1945662 RepID=UPI001F0AD93E|nr:hypothetical protein [Paracoccus contaminans]
MNAPGLAGSIEGLLLLLPLYGRVQAFLLALPATGERLLPVRVRAALGMAVTPLFAPMLDPAPLRRCPTLLRRSRPRS